MGISVSKGDKSVVVTLEGVLDTRVARELRDRLDQVEQEGFVTVVFDLTKTDFASSTAIGVMVAFANQHQSRYGNGSVVVCGLNPSIRRSLEVLGLIDIFVVVETLEDAEKLVSDFGGSGNGS